MKRLRNIFVAGCLVLVPILATLNLMFWFVGVVDSNTRHYLPTHLLGFDFPGLGLSLAVLIILVVGLLTHNYFGTWFLTRADMAIGKMPVVGGIYGAIKQFLETVFNPSTTQFKECVLVEFPRTGVFSIGFRTGNPNSKLTQNTPKGLTNVFVPCTPNPTSGFYLLVPENELIPLDISVQEAFKIVISMGIVNSDVASAKSK